MLDKLLPKDKDYRIMDIFIELCPEAHLRVVSRDGLEVVTEILPTHPKLAFLSDVEREAVGFPDNLRRDWRRRVERLESKVSKRLHKKATNIYMKRLLAGEYDKEIKENAEERKG